MGENLKVSKYNDGTVIPNVTDNTEWSNLKTGAWCHYNNSDSLGKIYGKLYNWFTVNPVLNKNICPSGWHVPKDSEWKTLIDYLGGESIAGGKLKEIGLLKWDSPNIGATNSSLFSGIGSGMRDYDGKYHHLNIYASYWSSSDYNQYNGASFHLNHNTESASIDDFGKDIGYSIRCLKD